MNKYKTSNTILICQAFLYGRHLFFVKAIVQRLGHRYILLADVKILATASKSNKPSKSYPVSSVAYSTIKPPKHFHPMRC